MPAELYVIAVVLLAMYGAAAYFWFTGRKKGDTNDGSN